MSSDLKYVLITTKKRKLHRYSYTAHYALYSVDTSSHSWISLDPADDPSSAVQLAAWAPKGHGLAFVYKNDLYYQADAGKLATDANSKVRLTKDGEPGVIFHGVPDWLYEEEVLGSESAVWFSPDGSKLLYATFDDSKVGEISLNEYAVGVDFLSLNRDVEAPKYPNTNTLRYPKVRNSLEGVTHITL